MARRKQTKGACVFCKKEMTRGGMAKHLPSCSQHRKASEAADAGKTKEQGLYRLQVQDAWQGVYWLHLEMNASATLQKLDDYLRAIWLECCGHLSQFSIGGWRGEEIPMTKRVEKIFSVGLELTHIYDFGTSSETTIKVVSQRKGRPLSKHPVFLMARNAPPEIPCAECDKPASYLCMECIYELDEPGTLCEQHAEGHPHDSYGEPMPIVNSPRVGMCGYEGPAEAPY
ncbi:MAG: plasmid pRiA4b ORF-3 family protein [bacterium]|nr:plasmid pRiA4b ORF-3 family protein [bacterium]